MCCARVYIYTRIYVRVRERKRVARLSPSTEYYYHLSRGLGPFRKRALAYRECEGRSRDWENIVPHGDTDQVKTSESERENSNTGERLSLPQERARNLTFESSLPPYPLLNSSTRFLLHKKCMCNCPILSFSLYIRGWERERPFFIAQALSGAQSVGKWAFENYIIYIQCCCCGAKIFAALWE